ncbi:MerR family transcriptional regulator [Cryptosporangium arvum]|jgi:DNA-binding transcriptional MerR regulator|uniref:MerR family transcriptional regulator n=1 Tax=Cryptosporangium arvum TaxID=80871 RepID=UPI0004B575A4|nr:MerR family transcriptional regulator [Cryptosporangium arvum]
MTPGLTVADTADKTGLTAHTLRYYERVGLIWGVERDAAGHRRYTSGQVDWLVLLTRLRATGMPIAGMLRYAELVKSGRADAERLDLLRDHRVALAARVAELTADLAVIDDKIAVYEQRLKIEP